MTALANTLSLLSLVFSRFCDRRALGIALFLGFSGMAFGQAPVWHTGTGNQTTAEGSGTSLSVARPANVVEGDLVILTFTQQRSASSTTSGFTTPAGFTLIRSEQASGTTEAPEIVAFYKIATASEPANYTSTVTNHGSTPNWKAVAARVTGFNALNPISAFAVGTNSGTSNENSITLPSFATDTDDSLLVAGRTVRRAITTETQSTGLTTVYTANGSGTQNSGNTNEPAMRVATQPIPTQGNTGSRQFTWSGQQANGVARTAGLMYAINPFVPSADLQLTMVVDNESPAINGTVNFTLEVTNLGPDNATGVEVTDQIPAGYSVVSVTPSAGTSWSAPTWDIGNLNVSDTATLEIEATVNATGPYTNVATVSGNQPDPVGGNDTARAGVLHADVAVTKTVDDPDADIGDTVVFTITAQNNGPSSATNVMVTDELPGGFTLVGVNTSQGSWADPVWNVGTLPASGSATLEITATVNPSGGFQNTAVITADNFDPNPSNNQSSVTLDVFDPVPTVNGLFYSNGDNLRYPSTPYARSDFGSELFVTLIDGVLYVAMVVDRSVSDNVFDPINGSAYKTSAGWGSGGNVTAQRRMDSEFAEFTLEVGDLSWTWLQGYAGQPDFGSGQGNRTLANWISDHTVSGGGGTPPPTIQSASSLAANLNNYATNLANGTNNWIMPGGSDTDSATWYSPWKGAGGFPGEDPNTVIDADEGYPAQTFLGDIDTPSAPPITYSPTYDWEWSVIYEWSVDLTDPAFGEDGQAPIFVITGNSHHSPSKRGPEDDPFQLVDEPPLSDYGDLPSPYLTLRADDGARHTIDPGGTLLGSRIDSEVDGQPHPNALGDDIAGVDDEDGVVFLTPFVAGSSALVQVTVGNIGGYLSGWIDFNGDGTLTQVNVTAVTGPATVGTGALGDRHFPAPGVYTLTIDVPSDATGRMPSRWRITNQADQGGNSITGRASSGEVEDYMIATVGDRVWHDINGNGIQDGGEPGIAGVTVRLLDANGNEVFDGAGDPVTTTTDSNGNYSFSVPPNVQYRAEVVPPSGFVVTAQNADSLGITGPANNDFSPSTNRTGAFSLTQGQTATYVDAGLYEPITIGDFVWEDLNGNGIQDPGEPGIEDVTVTLTGTDGAGNSVSLNTTTDSSGFYEFADLVPGAYTVTFVAPTGYVFTSQDADGEGIVGTANSDADVDTGEAASVSLASGDAVTYVDAGLYQPVSIGNFVWEDLNGDGIQDPGEPGLANVTVNLLDGSGNSVLDASGDPISVTTDANGAYSFTDLAPGTYSVQFELPANYVFSPQDADDEGVDGPVNSDADPVTGITDSVTLASGDTNNNLDAGAFILGSISGTILIDTNNDESGDTPHVGVTVQLLDEDGNIITTTTTDSTGFYEFTGLSPDVYQTRQLVPGGFTAIADVDGGDLEINGDETPIVIESGSVIEDQDFVNSQFGSIEVPTVCIDLDGLLNAFFIRPSDLPSNVVYTIESAANLGSPTVWTNVVELTTQNITVIDNGDGTETVIIEDVPSVTGFSSSGFFRVRVDLDADGNDEADESAFSDVLGWVESEFGIECRTFNDPFLDCPVLEGLVTDVNGLAVTLDQPAEVLDPGVAYFLEVASGDYAGHRFDIASASGNTFTVVAGVGSCGLTGPFTTWSGNPPVDLAGAAVRVHRHQTLSDLAPIDIFHATGDSATADLVTLYEGDDSTCYWLYADGVDTRWVEVGDAGLVDQGDIIIPQGHGVFVNSRTEKTVVSFGRVRTNDFVRPLCEDYNLVSTGFPIQDSAVSRDYTLANDFIGDADYTKASQFLIWNGDNVAGSLGYQTHYLSDWFNPERWVRAGDVMRVDRKDDILFLRDRAVFLRLRTALPAYTEPANWSIDLD